MERVCIVIKAANQKYDDVKVDCQLSWKIRELKHHLSTEYPSKPNVSEQRLIYSGHLLKDDQMLSEIIKPSSESNVFTFHLVCPQKQSVSASKNENKDSSKAAPSSTSPDPASLPTNLTGIPGTSYSPTDFINPMGPNNAAIHHSYNAMLSQYYQYMSYYYLSSPPTMDPVSYATFANAYFQNLQGQASNVATNPNLIATENLANNQAAAEVEADRAAAAFAEEDPNNQDWMDWMYSFSKAIVMVSIIYFYSSFTRLILLVLIGVFLYLYKNMANGAPNGNNVAAPVRPNEVAANNNVNEEENQNEVHESPDEADHSVQTEPSFANRFTGLRFLWVFVSSLFTSLIPDPNPIN